MNTSRDELVVHGPHFAERVRRNQQRLGSELKAQYDFIVCGSGSSGAVVAHRLAEHADVSVLLLEAGGQDDLPTVMRAGQWPMILGSEPQPVSVGDHRHLLGSYARKEATSATR
jgi:choline dehydrogenase